MFKFLNAVEAFIPTIHDDFQEGNIAMRDYSKISPQFWVGQTGRKIRQLGISSQLVALYLLTCPHSNMLGIYYLPIAYIVHDIGLDKEVVIKALLQLQKISFCSHDEQSEYIWIHEMAKYQIGNQLDIRDKRVKAVNELFYSLPELTFLDEFYKKYKILFHLEARCQEISHEQEISEQDNDSILSRSPLEGPLMPLRRGMQGENKPLRSQEQEQEQYQEQEQKQEQEEEQEQEGKHRRVLRHRQDVVLAKTQAPTPKAVSPSSFVITMPLRDDSEFSITSAMIDEWQLLYPTVDVMQLLKNIRGWNLANPNKRKTRKGILQHINQWLAKENSKPVKSSILEKPGGFNLFEHNTHVANAWLQDESFLETELINERE